MHASSARCACSTGVSRRRTERRTRATRRTESRVESRGSAPRPRPRRMPGRRRAPWRGRERPGGALHSPARLDPRARSPSSSLVLGVLAAAPRRRSMMPPRAPRRVTSAAPAPGSPSGPALAAAIATMPLSAPAASASAISGPPRASPPRRTARPEWATADAVLFAAETLQVALSPADARLDLRGAAQLLASALRHFSCSSPIKAHAIARSSHWHENTIDVVSRQTRLAGYPSSIAPWPPRHASRRALGRRPRRAGPLRRRGHRRVRGVPPRRMRRSWRPASPRRGRPVHRVAASGARAQADTMREVPGTGVDSLRQL